MASPTSTPFHRTVITALVLHVGIEALRAFLPLLVFGLRDRFGWAALGPAGSFLLLAIALAIFLPTFAADALTRRAGRSSMVRACVLGLVVFRLAAQVWQGDPLGNLVAVGLCLLCFLMFWPAWLATPQGRSPSQHRREVVLGTLLGTLLSATLHGLLRTYDLIWRPDGLHIGLTTGLLAVLVIVFWRGCEDPVEGPSPSVASTWFVFGPWLFLQVLIFLNLGRTTVLTGWSQGHAASLQVASHWLAFGLGAWLAAGAFSLATRRVLWAVAGLTLLAVLAAPWPVDILAAMGQLLGPPAATVLWMQSATRASRTSQSSMPGIGHGAGTLILLFLIFLYYAGYDLPLPFDQVLLMPFAALLLVVTGWPRSHDAEHTTGNTGRLPGLAPLVAAAALFLLLQPASDALKARLPRADAVTHGPLRVMTYNLHCGFGTQGYLRLEEQADIMRALEADVIALQEVSRGWVMNGGVDILAWLAQRLDMEFRYAPTADPLWGNATLSRRPIVASRSLDFPRSTEQQIRRGLVEITVTPPLLATSADPTSESRGSDIQPGDVTVINTHFHHRRADSNVRVEQAKIVLDFWQQRPRTLLVGDLNAPPESPEMQLLTQAGWIDTVAAVGQLPGYTFRADRLSKRIDYLWASPDLRPLEAITVPSTASDHLAIVLVVRRQKFQGTFYEE